jgi:MoxR-like ATPase
VGQDDVVEQFLTSFFAGGHCLLIGVPGLAKTLMIKSLSEILSLTFSRIQFTPDLLPGDITGADIIVEDKASHQRVFKFLKGPIFANIVLADEINRTPPKTQSALLEAMEEGMVTVGGNRYELETPFLVLATQNPIEQEGTYPLPVAALDRFMFNVVVDYPTKEDEKKIVKSTLSFTKDPVRKVLDRKEILELLQIVRRVHTPPDVLQFATDLVRVSRPKSPNSPQFIKDFLLWGSSPRGSQCMIVAGKARAMLHGRYQVTKDDIIAVAKPILRHRLIRSYHAEAEGVSTDDMTDKLLRHMTGEPEPGTAVEKTGFWESLFSGKKSKPAALAKSA